MAKERYRWCGVFRCRRLASSFVLFMICLSAACSRQKPAQPEIVRPAKTMIVAAGRLRVRAHSLRFKATQDKRTTFPTSRVSQRAQAPFFADREIRRADFAVSLLRAINPTAERAAVFRTRIWHTSTARTRRGIDSLLCEPAFSAVRSPGELPIAARSDPQEADECAPHHVDSSESNCGRHLFGTQVCPFEAPASGFDSHLQHVLRGCRADFSRKNSFEVPHTHRCMVCEILYRQPSL